MVGPKLVLPFSIKNKETNKVEKLSLQDAEAYLTQTLGNAILFKKENWSAKLNVYTGSEPVDANSVQGTTRKVTDHSVFTATFSNCPDHHFLLHFGQNILHKMNNPATTNDAKVSVLEGDENVLEWFSKLRGFYGDSHISISIQKGCEYHLADMIIRLGSIQVNNTDKGTILEIEYCPGVYFQECAPLLKEFSEDVLSLSDITFAPFRFADLPDRLYSERHMAFQYWAVLYSYKYLT